MEFEGDICSVLSRLSYGQRRVTYDKDSPCFLNIDALVDSLIAIKHINRSYSWMNFCAIAKFRILKTK